LRGKHRDQRVKKVVPTYPNATYHLSLKQWKNYRNPLLFEKGSFYPENIEPVFDAGQLKFVLEDMQLDEHVRLELYDGHTSGQIVVLFDTDEGNYAFPGDVVPTSLNLTLSWLSAYDNSVAIAMEEKNGLWTRQKRISERSFSITMLIPYQPDYDIKISPLVYCT